MVYGINKWWSARDKISKRLFDVKGNLSRMRQETEEFPLKASLALIPMMKYPLGGLD
jgi:hypothetical protein